VDPQALFNYLYCHVVPSPGSVYKGVRKLQPGECIVLRDGRTQAFFYWRMRYDERRSEDFDHLKTRFRRELRDATERSVDAGSNVGAFLSGGTDSSTVLGLLSEVRPRPARSYSIGFSADGFDEIGYARIAARHFASDAREYYVTPQDVADAIPLIAGGFDEPFGNASAVPTYYCARMARSDGMDVLLAGDGGDEIFGGNARYARQKLFEAYHRVPRALRAPLEYVAFGVPGAARVAPVRKLRSYIDQARIPLPARLESYNFLERSPLADIFEPEFLAAVDTGQPAALQRDAYERSEAASAVNRMMHLDLKFTLADNDLRKVSRMCELAGVEVRYPLIADRLVQLSGEIRPSLQVRRLRLRYFFKKALSDFLPAETLAKTKHGFGLPFGLWLKEHAGLADIVHESLCGFERRGILKPAYTRELLSGHARSHATYFGVMIWVVMMLEQWLAARKL
jgi:asparagine synthase (glutamine-hydrolysing)